MCVRDNPGDKPVSATSFLCLRRKERDSRATAPSASGRSLGRDLPEETLHTPRRRVRRNPGWTGSTAGLPLRAEPSPSPFLDARGFGDLPEAVAPGGARWLPEASVLHTRHGRDLQSPVAQSHEVEMSFSGRTVQERPSPAQRRAFNLDPLQALPLVPRTLPAPKNPPAGHSQWVPEYTRGETAMSPPAPLGVCQDQCVSWARPCPLLATHLERALRPVYRAGLSRPRGRPWPRQLRYRNCPSERPRNGFSPVLASSCFRVSFCSALPRRNLFPHFLGARAPLS